MMEKARISIVSYLNSRPFLYGLTNSQIVKQINLTQDIPSKIVSKLEYKLADIGLIPVAGLNNLDDYQIISDYCIGSVGKVKTVVLASEVPLENVQSILMDYQSRSSVLLAKVLAKFYWKKSFLWENTCSGFENKSISGSKAGVVIGDRVFDIENKYPFIYDLSEEWLKFTGLPFVFAVWAANKPVSRELEINLNSAFAFGLEKISEIVQAEQLNYPGVDIYKYFSDNISFEFDNDKREGMKKFLELASKLETVEFS